MSQYEVIFAGFGGQGVLTAGQMLAYAGIEEGKQVAWIPSYGPEMRGGTASCTVVVSESRIGSPIVNQPRGICVFNRPSLEKFAPMVRAHGLVIINSSLIDIVSGRSDVTEILVPASDIALKAGNVKMLNMIMLGAFVGATGIVKEETLQAVLREKMGARKEILAMNERGVDEGYRLGRAALPAGVDHHA